MYFLRAHHENARVNGSGIFAVPGEGNSIRKWTILPAGPSGTELLRLIAMVCGGTAILPQLPFPFPLLVEDQGKPLQIELLMAGPIQGGSWRLRDGVWATGVRMPAPNTIEPLKASEYRFLSPSDLTVYKAKTGLGNSWSFFLGYGTTWCPHSGTDSFDFSDIFFRLTRFRSLFCDDSFLTDPVAFLKLLHYRAIRHRRLPPMHVMEALFHLLPAVLGIDTTRWRMKECDFLQEWGGLQSWQRHALLPILDMIRHLLDGYPREKTPLDVAVLALFDRPDRFIPEGWVPAWTGLLDLLFPNIQFVVTLSDRARRMFPASLTTRSCWFETPIGNRPERVGKLPQGTILLVDVDGTLPNLALMKLGRHFKNEGRPVMLVRREARIKNIDAVFAGCVFSRELSRDRVRKLHAYYGQALTVGGSGLDVHKRLPREIENLEPDYSLYPELGDRGIGFITRGCPFHCPFCIVPVKEGKPHQVSTLRDLLPDGRKKLILLDDNILAHPMATKFLQEMAAGDVAVNFTQTLDLRLVDEEKARLLQQIRCSNLRFTRRVCHFSLNDTSNLEEVRRKYALFGFSPKDNVEFVCMYGFNTTLAQDVQRFRFLSTLPGAYVFVQQYQPIPGGPPASLEGYFDEQADEHIDDLVRIVFRQNMKSMENYYRWVSREYARTFGRLHQGLVDAIFKYNHREMKGHYMATMGGLIRRKDLVAMANGMRP